MPARPIAGLVVACLFTSASTASSQDLGEVAALRWCEGTKDCLEWDAVPGSASYLVHRGDSGSLAFLANEAIDSCIAAEPRAPTTGRVLADEPQGGGLHWFLVTASEDSSAGSGTLGARTLDTSGPCCRARVVDEEFAGSDGAPWPAPWRVLGDVDSAELSGGMARLRPVLSSYSLARMGLAGNERDAEATFTLRFDDLATQGVGFYLRQNGGHLSQTDPPGSGYAVFIEGFRGTQGIGLWKEQDGNEIDLRITFDDALGLENGSRFRVRFRCQQIDPFTTDLRARIWREGEPEPLTWQVELQDSSPEQQGLSGGIAVDAWSSHQTGGPTPAFVAVDDIVVTPLCSPLDGAGLVETVAEGFAFTEGPAWSGDELYFSDVRDSIVHRLVPPAEFSVFRPASEGANGLVVEPDGSVIACEHGSRSLTRTTSEGITTSVVTHYLGDRFNSPNDLARSAGGTLYFTDPPYGLPSPADREIPFNGLFRLTPAGALTPEWMGDPDATRPNGVVLSPDGGTLYMADSAQGTVLAFLVNPDGSLGTNWTFARGLATPDGMSVDRRGNLQVATWASTVEVFAPNGGLWGRLAIPRQATNCSFGGEDLRTLYVTAQEGLYAIRLEVPGVPSR